MLHDKTDAGEVAALMPIAARNTRRRGVVITTMSHGRDALVEREAVVL
jgi:hypothetical protein